MEHKELTINGTRYEFLLDARNTQYGFKHICELVINGYHAQTATAYYYNRTWESYRFQSVMRKAVYEELQYIEDNIKMQFMEENGYKRMSKNRQLALDCITEDNATIQELQTVLARI